MFSEISAHIGFLLFLFCIFATLFGLLALPGLIYTKKIRFTWPTLTISPAIITGLLIHDPWFTINPNWRWIRILILLSWIPIVVVLENLNRITYEIMFKWLSRAALYSLLVVLTLWAFFKTERWGLIQSHNYSGTWYWLAVDNRGDDAWIFSRNNNGHISSQKVLDSALDTYSYSFRKVGDQIEITSSLNGNRLLYNPTTRTMEFIRQIDGVNETMYSKNGGSSWEYKK